MCMSSTNTQSHGVVPQGSSLAGQPIHSIASLNPYINRWVIKARVTAKSDIRNYSNQKGQGQLASVDLLDAQVFNI